MSAEIRFIGVQPNEGTVHMIVIGADTHKGSHALAAVDDGTGRVRGQREIRADDAGHLAAVKWARSLDAQRVWAIEDCRAVSRRFEHALSIARAVVKDGVEAFPVAHLDEQAMKCACSQITAKTSLLSERGCSRGCGGI